MNHLTRTVSFWPALALVGVLGGCTGVISQPQDNQGDAQAALSTDVCPPGVPATLTPPAGESLKLKLSAIGVQIYSCNATPAGGYGWTFLAPQADLFNDDGQLVGTHFIGPTWQSNDGSSVVGKKIAGATIDASAVPWLLLQGVSHAAEAGRFSEVTSIQRLSTVGGLAPTDACDATHNLGAIVQVPYSADYMFYEAKTNGNVKQCGGS
jgi:hypothetical protein